MPEIDKFAPTGEIAKFWSILSSNSKSKITLRKFSCLSDNFEFSNGHLGEMAKYIGNFFFVIFGQINLFYILAEFEVDVMRPNDSSKMDKRALKA